jgi:hypothetical protein
MTGGARGALFCSPHNYGDSRWLQYAWRAMSSATCTMDLWIQILLGMNVAVYSHLYVFTPCG